MWLANFKTNQRGLELRVHLKESRGWKGLNLGDDQKAERCVPRKGSCQCPIYGPLAEAEERLCRHTICHQGVPRSALRKSSMLLWSTISKALKVDLLVAYLLKP